MDKKICSKCGIERELIEFPGRRRVCTPCSTAARQRTLERREQIAFTLDLGERIADMLAAGMTVAEVCAQSAMPTPRQLKAWRRANPDFDAACLQAETESAAAHLDKAKETLRKVEDGKLPASDGRVLFDGHMRLASTLNPSRYGTHATVDVTSAGRPLVDFGAAVEALINSLPTRALPAPEPLDADATPVSEERVLQ